jgi:hypothetical protein
VRYRTPLISLAAGLFTPLPLLVLFDASSAGAPPAGWQATLVTAFLAALGVALWRPVSPVYFGSALIAAAPVWCAVLAGNARSSNLFGLALMFVAVAGVIVGVSVGFAATLIRHWPVPSWAPVPPLAAAALLIPLARLSGQADASSAARLLLEIARAESEYAAAHPDRGYSCEGPELPLQRLDWRAAGSLGTTERNEAQYGRFLIQLRCEASARPSYFTASAIAAWAGGPRYTFDSRRRAIEIR